SLRNGFREQFVLAPKVLVKSAHGQTGRLHYAGHARAAQPLSAEFASGVSHDTIASSRLVPRFVTHISYPLDYIRNPRTQPISLRGGSAGYAYPSSRWHSCPDT